MKQWFFLLAVALSAAANSWNFLDAQTSDPSVRMEQLLNQGGEDIRRIESPRFWLNDQPSHLTPIRVHGGIGP
jgi:hypothetical protein